MRPPLKGLHRDGHGTVVGVEVCHVLYREGGGRVVLGTVSASALARVSPPVAPVDVVLLTVVGRDGDVDIGVVRLDIAVLHFHAFGDDRDIASDVERHRERLVFVAVDVCDLHVAGEAAVAEFDGELSGVLH